MKSYLDIVSKVLAEGTLKHNRTGVDALTVPFIHFQHDMTIGFPLLTTKKMAIKSILVELEGFLRGITDKKWYQDRGSHIWSEWSNPIGTPNWFDAQTRKDNQKKDTDLGPIYGFQWRTFDGRNVPTPRNLDNLTPTVVGVGVILNNSKFNLDLKSTWYGMINRCYNQNDKDYYNYGKKGIYVCNRWLTYEYFEEDVMRLPGWGLKKEDTTEYTLDKDKSGHKCYGPNSCSWVSRKEQACFRSDIKPIYALSPNNEVYYFRSIKECAETFNLDTTGISHCLSGKQQSHNQWQFWRDTEHEEIVPVDQLKTILNSLKNNPNDRRMVCSAWNPNQISIMALPPCHLLWNVVVIEGVLHLGWFQRSCDLMLGVPFNIASYATLMLLLCKYSGLQPGTLNGILADCHIYQNHIEGARLQLTRQPLQLPQLNITVNPFDLDVDDIVKWTYKDIELLGYSSHDKIPLEVAI